MMDSRIHFIMPEYDTQINDLTKARVAVSKLPRMIWTRFSDNAPLNNLPKLQYGSKIHTNQGTSFDKDCTEVDKGIAFQKNK